MEVKKLREHPELLPETDESPEAEPQVPADAADEESDEERITVEYIGFDDEE